MELSGLSHLEISFWQKLSKLRCLIRGASESRSLWWCGSASNKWQTAANPGPSRQTPCSFSLFLGKERRREIESHVWGITANSAHIYLDDFRRKQKNTFVGEENRRTFILFYFTLFQFILFYFILYYFILSMFFAGWKEAISLDIDFQMRVG